MHIQGCVVFTQSIQVATVQIFWSDETRSEELQLERGRGGVLWAEPGTTIWFSHWYLANGDYLIQVQVIPAAGQGYMEFTKALEIRIGPYTRLFKDPRDGSEYLIYDGTVLVAFKDPERFEDLDHDMAEEPDIKAFLEAENLKVRNESPHIGSMQVILPPETTVEEAVGEWPDKYPDLIEAVDPNSVDEFFQ